MVWVIQESQVYTGELGNTIKAGEKLMFNTMNFTYVFVMAGSGGYDPWITTFTDLRESNARHKAWDEVSEEWGLTEVDYFMENEDGTAQLVAVFETEPGKRMKSLL
jgi:hypothetical protein